MPDDPPTEGTTSSEHIRRVDAHRGRHSCSPMSTMYTFTGDAMLATKSHIAISSINNGFMNSSLEQSNHVGGWAFGDACRKRHFANATSQTPLKIPDNFYPDSSSPNVVKPIQVLNVSSCKFFFMSVVPDAAE
jgi:hypothetical protein